MYSHYLDVVIDHSTTGSCQSKLVTGNLFAKTCKWEPPPPGGGSHLIILLLFCNFRVLSTWLFVAAVTTSCHNLNWRSCSCNAGLKVDVSLMPFPTEPWGLTQNDLGKTGCGFPFRSSLSLSCLNVVPFPTCLPVCIYIYKPR